MSVAAPVIDFIDGPNRRIHLLSGVTSWNPVDDIYAEVRQARRINEDLRKYDSFCSALPLVQKAAGVFTGRALILLNGTRIMPFDESATQEITGELLSDEGLSGVDLIDTSLLSSMTKLKISYVPPPATEVITIETGGVQDVTLQRIRDILEADEEFTATQAIKRHKDTKAILVQKDATSGPTTPVTLIEPI